MQGSASTRPQGRGAEPGCSCTNQEPIRCTERSRVVVEAAAFPGHQQPLGKGQVAGLFSSQFSFLRVFREKKSQTFLNLFHSRFELPLKVQPAKSCPLPAALAALCQPGPGAALCPWPELSPCAEALAPSAPQDAPQRCSALQQAQGERVLLQHPLGVHPGRSCLLPGTGSPDWSQLPVHPTPCQPWLLPP